MNKLTDDEIKLMFTLLSDNLKQLRTVEYDIDELRQSLYFTFDRLEEISNEHKKNRLY